MNYEKAYQATCQDMMECDDNESLNERYQVADMFAPDEARPFFPS